MKKFITTAIVAAALFVGVSPAGAISTPPGYLHPTPCARLAEGHSVYEHLRYWANHGWFPWGRYVWLNSNSGLICRVSFGGR